MRKRQQREIIEVLKTLKTAQDAELYADCQEGAIGIGEFEEIGYNRNALGVPKKDIRPKVG
ncbi:MAG: hypothetical protein FWE83_01220 [Oscillospiraceae bacterium]|nr:hypothetical protein [Oscillospiraceae bacterium]